MKQHKRQRVSFWEERGYADFADGIFGNGGQNLYVSRAGILQRIFRFDLNRDGHADVVFCNSQDFNDRPPAHVYTDVLGRREVVSLPTQGGYAGAMGDLNADGYDELVIGNAFNGTHGDLCAFVYYGSAEGLSERYKIELPAPRCISAAIGDFNGDGRPDLAFATQHGLRIFYQTEEGFLPSRFVDFDLPVTHLVAGDLDGDGCAELYARVRKQAPLILWGSSQGIDLKRKTRVGGARSFGKDTFETLAGGKVFVEGWKPKIVRIRNMPYLFRPEEERFLLFPVSAEREVGDPLTFKCADAIAIALGDVDGDGWEDLAVATSHDCSKPSTSWIYWGSAKGFSDSRRLAFSTLSARDVAIADLDSDGHGEIIVCQGATDVQYSTHSPVLHATGKRALKEKVRLSTHDATTVLVGHAAREAKPQVVIINHATGHRRGDIPIYIYYGGPGGFSPVRRTDLPGWSSPNAVCSDFNDDGWPDLLVANCSENAPHLDPGSFLYWGGREGFHPSRKLVLPTVRAHGSAVGDFRRCGHLDLAIAGFFNPELLIFQGGPNGFDLEHPQRILLDPELKNYRARAREIDWGRVDPKGKEYREPRWLLAADFNRDGWLDLWISQVMSSHSLILWGGPEGFSLERSTPLATEGGICAQAADLTGNGWLDLVIGGHASWSRNNPHESSIYIYWGGPEGFREDRKAQLPAHTCNSLAIADFNRDGVLDIFATSYNNGRQRDLDSYLYWGLPGGRYSADRRTRFFTHSACGCTALDFNEDGWIDLAIANHKTYGNHVGLSQIWWNGPGGFSEERITHLPANGPHGMLAVDAGNILNRGPEEFYVSSPFELPAGARVTKVQWKAEIQKKTWVRGQLRFAPTLAALDDAPWQGANGSAAWLENGQETGRLRQTGNWIQYRLALGAVNGGNSPRVTSVRVEFAVPA